MQPSRIDFLYHQQRSNLSCFRSEPERGVLRHWRFTGLVCKSDGFCKDDLAALRSNDDTVESARRVCSVDDRAQSAGGTSIGWAQENAMPRRTMQKAIRIQWLGCDPLDLAVNLCHQDANTSQSQLSSLFWRR